MKPRILVIDDEAAIREMMRMILEYEGYECLLAATGQEALGLMERATPDLAFLDIKMPGMDGLEVLSRIRSIDDGVPVVMISGHATISDAVTATKLGAFDFIEKPLASERVLVTVRNAIDATRLKTEVGRLRQDAEAKYRIAGDSPALKRVLDDVARAAPTNATVLILGESGVGKELVARAIHRNSQRAKERFVQVNCAAIPEELIESELFGHEKGSFTGAVDKQLGKFDQADRGTIFLDEVGDMSPKTQAKVLRVLQEGEVERIGSAKTFKVDVRVIAATNKDLEAEIAKGTFREDLYFRLSVIPISVPPLRDRNDDIPSLIRHFMDLFVREGASFRAKRFTPAAMTLLQQQRWKGNIRELRNTIERVLIMSRGETIDDAELRGILRLDAGHGLAPSAEAAVRSAGVEPASGGQGTGGSAEEAAATAPPAGTDAPPIPGGGAEPASPPGAAESARPSTLKEFKEQAERAFLVERLRENNWNISKTAEVIGTPRSNLYKKLEQYQISQQHDG
ncbi:MAG: response regulator [Luteitalea sp.]|nr:response regulator [Luteitalea sp.]